MIKKHKNYLIYWLALSNIWTSYVNTIKKGKYIGYRKISTANMFGMNRKEGQKPCVNIF